MSQYASSITLRNGRKISLDEPTYFVADVGSNHDGDIRRAKDLIWLAKEAQADAIKFQHFKADKIVSDYGFKELGQKLSHQKSWTRSVFETYRHYECTRSWLPELFAEARKAKIDFFSSPYDFEALDLLDQYVEVFKIGSGDITWLDFIESVARKNKPVFLATGASNMNEVEKAVARIASINKNLVLMQCNTNYTADAKDFEHLNLKVLQTFAQKYPGILLGLSDHTMGHVAALGAIALGARVIEKHFTDDNRREGPDHPFAMNPVTWREMVERSRELEAALGDGIKRVEENECDTVVIQRRGVHLARDMKAGEKIDKFDIEFLRPAPRSGLIPGQEGDVIGKTISHSKPRGASISLDDIQ